MEYQRLKGLNFITPNIVRCEESSVIEGTKIELSRGKGFTGNSVFGVTVWVNYKHNHSLSKLFHSAMDAEDYIREILNGL